MLWRTLPLEKKKCFKKEGMEMEVRIRRKIIKKRELTSYSRPYMTIYLNSEYHKRWGKNSTCKNKSCFILKMIYTWKYLILKKDIYIYKEEKWESTQALRYLDEPLKDTSICLYPRGCYIEEQCPKASSAPKHSF